jgi:DNA-binding transcriptional regulator YiaG
MLKLRLQEKNDLTFSERIKRARLKMSLSQAEASRQWGFSQPLMNMWESGRRNPCGLYRERLEKALGRIEKGF